jgi:hypothetical protein
MICYACTYYSIYYPSLICWSAVDITHFIIMTVLLQLSSRGFELHSLSLQDQSFTTELVPSYVCFYNLIWTECSFSGAF